MPSMRWLFADDCKKAIDLEFVQLKAHVSKKGKTCQVMVWLGREGDFVGEFQCFPSSIVNLKELIDKLGKEEYTWKEKLFTFTPEGKKFRCTV